MLNSKVTYIKNIRKKIIPYMLCWIFFYTWMVLFFTWWVNDFDNSLLFSKNQLFIVYLLLLIFIAIIIFIVHPKKFKRYYFVGGVGSTLLLIMFYLSTYINFFKYTLYIFPLFIGLTFIGLLQMFIYIMNNTEKFYSLVFSNFLLILIVILQDIKLINFSNNFFALVVSLIISTIPIIKTNDNDYVLEEKEYSRTAPKISKVLYISLILNCIFLVFERGVGRGLLLLANDMYPFNLEIYYYLGALVGCIIMFLLFNYVKRCNSLAWNTTFSLFILASFLYMWPSSEFIKNLFAFVLGIGVMMGINFMYYMLGVISKKYWDFSYIRYNILITGLIGCGFGTLLGNYIYSSGNEKIVLIILTISVFIIISLLIISPLLITTFFNDKWTEDATKALIDNLNKRKFDKYNLTLKEMEVCNYIVNNYTVRQIAASMKISENTVKFHKKQIFKKVGVSSKNELSNVFNN